jgi:hypothetical protein
LPRVSITPDMEGTLLSKVLQVMDQCGMSLLVHNGLPLADFLDELLAAVPRLVNSEETNSGMMRVREADFDAVRTPFNSSPGSLAVICLVPRSQNHLGRAIRELYLDPVLAMGTTGSTVTMAMQGEMPSEEMAEYLRLAYT